MLGDAGPARAARRAARRSPRRRTALRYRVFALVCLVALVFGAVGLARAQGAPDSTPETAAPASPAAPSISLLTIGPGEIFFERFGHNAIVVRDASGSAVAYNYGIFDFNEGDFLTNFARGRMRYRIAADELEDDLQMYRDEGRRIVEQPLGLAPAQATALAGFLEWNARPENAHYRYDYFEANCSTRVRDALDRATGGQLHAQTEGRSRGYSYRLDALRLMAAEPALMLLIDLGLGPFSDRRMDYWQESYVPDILAHVVTTVRLPDANGGVALADAGHTLAAGHIEEAPALPPDLRWPFLGLGVALALGLIWLGGRSSAGRRVPLAVFAGLFELFCGLGGLVLLFLWFGSEHRAAWRNENLLLLDPLCLLLVPAWFAGVRRRARTRAFTRVVAWVVVVLAGFALFSKILPWFAQANLHWIVLFLPLHLALAIALMRRQRGAF